MVLICSMGTDPSACTAETALDVMVFSPTRMCGLPQVATVARTAIAPEMGKSFAKIICERKFRDQVKVGPAERHAQHRHNEGLQKLAFIC